jgi:hypothetical protein
MPLPFGGAAAQAVEAPPPPVVEKLTNPQVLEAAMVRMKNDAEPVMAPEPVVRVEQAVKKTRVRPSGYRPLYLNYQTAPAYHEPQGMEKLMQHNGRGFMILLLVFSLLVVVIAAFVMLPS